MAYLLLFLFSTDGAIALCKNKDYEAALAIFERATPPPSLRNEHFFYRAVCEHQTGKKSLALLSLDSLLDSFTPIPVRYERTARLMKADLESWRDDDTMRDIGRRMGRVGHRLETSKGGDETQRQQRDILEILDRLVREKENPIKSPVGRVGESDPPTTPSGGDASGKGDVDAKHLKKIAENWGGLPPEARRKIIQELTPELPKKYSAQIENYYKELNRSK